MHQTNLLCCVVRVPGSGPIQQWCNRSQTVVAITVTQIDHFPLQIHWFPGFLQFPAIPRHSQAENPFCAFLGLPMENHNNDSDNFTLSILDVSHFLVKSANQCKTYSLWKMSFFHSKKHFSQMFPFEPPPKSQQTQ